MGLPETTAVKRLGDAGFAIAVSRRAQEGAAVVEGAVVDQAPSGGKHAKEGATVHIVVETG